jgi:hypothetical protein
VRIAVLVALGVLLAGCHEDAAKMKVLRITESAQAKNPNAGLSSEGFLDGAARVQVTGYTDLPPFFVLARTPALVSIPAGRATRCRSRRCAAVPGRLGARTGT